MNQAARGTVFLAMIFAALGGCGGDGPSSREPHREAGTEDAGPPGDGDADAAGRDSGVANTECISGTVHALVAQGDKLLVGGQRSNDVLVARYDDTGALDPSFGEGGFVTHDLGGPTAGALPQDVDAALGLTVSGGNVWVAGFGRGFAGGAEASFALLKLDDQGALDGTFGEGGFRVLDVGGPSRFHTVRVDDSGRPWATGTLEDGSGADLVVARFTAAGPLDEDFPEGPDNGVILDNGGEEYGLHSLLTPDGIVVGGNSLLTRIGETGARDEAFGEGGFFASAGGAVQGLLALPSGGLMVAGFVTDAGADDTERHTLRLTKLTASGQPDASFGAGGTVEQAYDLTLHTFEDGERLDGNFTLVRGLAATPDGGLLVYTSVIGPLANTPVLLRLSASGAPELAFGQQGIAAIRAALPLLGDLARPGGSSQLVVTGDRYAFADEFVEAEQNCIRVVPGRL
jgi:uncharacterized delta-60 repeat protein